jgi:hypothetical protein
MLINVRPQSATWTCVIRAQTGQIIGFDPAIRKNQITVFDAAEAICSFSADLAAIDCQDLAFSGV